ncbi:hypothetical protein M3Y98_00086400 [Aphelenchoides besseyi]|nr:hypothetical protein M3Y98_00086400 [Aphelenchoides besseyi]KAI6198463.1 hypothetical protein M3Y96_00521900 [Aphelenchoides besseyi]
MGVQRLVLWFVCVIQLGSLFADAASLYNFYPYNSNLDVAADYERDSQIFGGPLVKRKQDWRAMFGTQRNEAEDPMHGLSSFKGLRGKRSDAPLLQRPSMDTDGIQRPCNVFKLISCY